MRRSGPGAGTACTCAVSDMVGDQPDRPRSNEAGGRTSSATSSLIGDHGSRVSSSAQPESRPSPVGCPDRKPSEAGAMRASTTSMSGSPPRPSGVSTGRRSQSPNGGSAIGAEEMSPTCGSGPGTAPSTTAISTHGRSSWSRRARTCVAARPRRSTSTVTTAGPGSGARRNVPVTASGTSWRPPADAVSPGNSPAVSASSSTAAWASTATRYPPCIFGPVRHCSSSRTVRRPGSPVGVVEVAFASSAISPARAARSPVRPG